MSINEDVKEIYGIDVPAFLKANDATSIRILREMDMIGGGPDVDVRDGRITVIVTKDDKIVRITDVWRE